MVKLDNTIRMTAIYRESARATDTDKLGQPIAVPGISEIAIKLRRKTDSKWFGIALRI